MLADAEILSLAYDIFKELKLDVIIKVNNRKLLNGILEQADITKYKDDVILVVPTNEKDNEVQKNIHEYVRMIKDRFYKDNPLITDAQALKRDLSNHAVVMYGTTEGNLLLAKYSFPAVRKGDCGIYAFLRWNL